MKRAIAFLVGCILMFGMPLGVQAGHIVVNNDEWTLSDSAWITPDSGVFALNVAKWFTGGGTGRFLVYSSDFGLTESKLNSTMTSAGNTWEIADLSSFTNFNAAYLLQNYDGVFLAANPVDNTELTAYVNGGGNVYLAGGTGPQGAEAAAWNQFLGAFGLQFSYYWNGIVGNIAINSSHPIFDGVHNLFQVTGNSIFLTDPPNPDAQILISYNGEGLYAVYDSNPVPEPGAMWLLGTGLVGLLTVRRRIKG